MELAGVSKMPAYRLYHLDGAGKVASAEWLDADGDDSALEKARASRRSGRCELWQGARLVSRLDGQAD